MFSKLKQFFKKNEINGKKKLYKKAPLKRKTKKKIKRKFGKEDEKSFIQKLGLADKKKKENEKFLAYEDFEGIVKQRKKTDKYYIIPIAIFFLILIIRLIFILSQSNPKKLAYGLDFRTEFCGLSHLSQKKYVYFIHPNVDINLKICIKKCPEATNKEICLYRRDGINYHTEKRFCYSTIQSRAKGRFCIPVETKTRHTVENYLNRFNNGIGFFIGDVYLSWDYIFIGFILALIFSQIFSFFFQYGKFLFFFLLFSILAFPVFFFGVSIIFYLEYINIIELYCFNQIVSNLCIGYYGKIFYGLFIFFFVLAILSLLTIFCFISKIYRTIKFIKNCCNVFKTTLKLKNLYLVFNFFIMIFCIFSFFFILYLFSSGQSEIIDAKKVDGNKVKKYIFSTRKILFFDLIIIFLFFRFINDLNKICTCFIITDWYFTRKKKSLNFSFTRNIWIFFSKHFGTFCKFILLKHFFGWLKIISRSIFIFLKKSNNDSDIIRFFISIFFPLIVLDNKFLRFIDISSFVQTSLFGSDYNLSSKKNFYLKNERNTKFEFKYLKWIQKILLFNKILLISVLGFLIYTSIFFFKINLTGNIQVMDFHFSPSIFFFIFGFFITHYYFSNYIQMIDTILICYLIDIEMFVGDQLYYENLLDNFSKKYIDYSINMDNDGRYFGIKLFKNNERKKYTQVHAMNYFDTESELDKSITGNESFNEKIKKDIEDKPDIKNKDEGKFKINDKKQNPIIKTDVKNDK